jgi:hypothetical protein
MGRDAQRDALRGRLSFSRWTAASSSRLGHALLELVVALVELGQMLGGRVAWRAASRRSPK